MSNEIDVRKILTKYRNVLFAAAIILLMELICEILNQVLKAEKGPMLGLLYPVIVCCAAIVVTTIAFGRLDSIKYFLFLCAFQTLLILILFPNDVSLNVLLPVLFLPILVVINSIKSRFRYPVLLAIFLFDFILALFISLVLLKLPIDKALVSGVIYQTNPEEALNYVISLGPIPPILTIAIFSVLVASKLKLKSISSRHSLKELIFCLLISSVAAYAGYLITIEPYVAAGMDKAKQIELYVQLKKDRATFLGQQYQRAAESENDGCCQTHVVIIGESMNRHHMELYGYKRKTTPNLVSLASQKQLVIFDDVISPSASTMESLAKVLTNSTNETNLPFNKSVSIIQMLRAAKFETDWISNQLKYGLWDNQVGVIADDSNYVDFINHGAGKFIPVKMDEELLPPIAELLAKKPSTDRIIFIHLIGCHSTYQDRFTPNYNLFVDTPPVETVNPFKTNLYDSCVAYNDHVVGKMIELFGKYNVSTALYFSDHGEDIEFGMQHTAELYQFRKSMVEIPMILWSSEKFRNTHQDLFSQISKNTEKRFMTDGLFNSLFDLYGVRSKDYDPTRSIFNKAYIERTRKTLNGKLNYDQ